MAKMAPVPGVHESSLVRALLGTGAHKGVDGSVRLFFSHHGNDLKRQACLFSFRLLGLPAGRGLLRTTWMAEPPERQGPGF